MPHSNPAFCLVPDTRTAFAYINLQLQHVQLVDPLAPAWVVMPAHLARSWRIQATESLNVHVLTTGQLAPTLLRAIGHSKQALTSRQRVLRLSQIMATAHSEGRLKFLPAPAQAPNLARHIDSLIQDIKLAGISAQEFLAEAKLTESERDVDLAMLFSQYEEMLRREDQWDSANLISQVCIDEEEIWAALGPLSYVGVAGYEVFNPLELRLLRSVQERVDRFEIHYPAGSDQSSQELAAETARSLGLTFSDQVLESIRTDGGASPIHVEAPTLEHEVRHVLRQIKQRHIKEGIPLAEFTICLPDFESYQPLLHSCADEYGMPLALDRSLSLHPLAQALQQLLYLVEEYSWHACWEVLESPFVKQSFLDERDKQDLRQITAGRITAGLTQWKTALGWAKTGPGQNGLPPERVATIETRLEAFFAACRPPATQNPQACLTWIANLLPNNEAATLCLTLPDSPDLKEQNAGRVAWVQIRKTVEAMRSTPREWTATYWNDMRSHIVEELHQQKLQIYEPGTAVQVVSFNGGWNQPTTHIYILGLNEGVLPRIPNSGPFHTHQERLDSNLPLPQFDPRLAQLQWTQLLANSAGQATLSRPTSDVELREIAPSIFWPIAAATQMLGRSQIPPYTEAASLTELAIALQDQRVRTSSEMLQKRLQQAAILAKTVTARLSTGGPVGPYEGQLAHRDILQELQRKFDLDTTWSPSSLQDYARCPMGFLAKRILHLEPEPQAALELEPVTRGLVLHDILHKVLAWVRDHKIEMAEANAAEVGTQALEFVQETWGEVRGRHRLQPYALDGFDLRQIENLTMQAIQLDLNDSDWQPLQLEWGFGDGSPVDVTVRHMGKTWTLPLRGIVDRIDRSVDGHLRVIDYKSRSSNYTAKEMAAALNTQVLLYALVVNEQGWGHVSNSGYRMLLDTKSGKLKNEIDWHEGAPAWVDQIAATLGQHQDDMRMGRFPAAPPYNTGSIAKCAEWCALAEFCQPSSESRQKAAKAFKQ